jgi:hypothetical protein
MFETVQKYSGRVSLVPIVFGKFGDKPKNKVGCV